MMRAIITFQGFTESLETITGTEELYRRVVRKFSGPECMTMAPLEWDHAPKKVVGLLKRSGVESVVVIGYSWGAGYGAQRFAREAGKAGIAVSLMLLCDPVYRPQWLPAWLPAHVLSARSLFRKSAKITVPACVEKVAAVYQTKSIPAGHELKISGKTKYLGKTILDIYRHTSIDSSPYWFQMVRHQLEREFDGV